MDLLERIDLLNIVLRLVGILAVILAGRWLAGRSRKWLQASLARTDLSESFITLFVTLANLAILFLTVAVVLILAGVPATAVVGAMGVLLIVLAVTLQASLANLAATVLFLLFKPFQVGDLIATAGYLGVVQEIQLFSTALVSPDRKTHFLPNSKIQGAGITNLSRSRVLRADLAIGVGYNSDLERAKEVVSGILDADEAVLKEPAPYVFVGGLGESAVELAAWPYVEAANYLAFQTTIYERVKKGLDEAGIAIPFPQRDVHVINQDGRQEGDRGGGKR